MSGRTKLVLIAIVVAAVGYEVVSVLVERFTPGPGGATSSSYATSSDGLAAYAELLQRTGHHVTQLRGATANAQLSPSQTVIALDPNQLTSTDVDRLKAFVQAGGQLVAGGTNPRRWVRDLLGDPPTWSSNGLREATPSSSTPYTLGISKVTTAGNGRFISSGQTSPALGAPGGSLLTVAQLGAGRIALMADASPLQNSLLGKADNAVLGDRVAGAPGRPVTFLEGIHGYGASTGLAALPARWKWTILGLLLASAAWIASRFRRLGEPDAPPSSPLPPRLAHVEALATALERTRRPSDAVKPVRVHARELVVRRAALGPDPKEDAIVSAARNLGLDDAEARVVASEAPGGTEGDLLAAGRALSSLHGGGT
jgi:uncharacterized protein DUF4350